MSNAEYGKLLQRKWQERMEDDHLRECPECCWSYKYSLNECPKCGEE